MRLQSASAACGLFAPLLLLCCARNVSADIHLSASECNAAKGGCASALSSAITQCGQQQGLCRVSLSPGDYNVTVDDGGTALDLSSLNNVELVGAPGVSLLMDNRANLLVAGACSNMTISDLVVDMTRQPYTLGTFEKIDGNDTVFSFNASSYPFPAQPTPNQRYLFQVQSLLEYDTAAGRPAANALDVYIQDAPVGLAVSSPTTVSLKDTASASWAKSLTAGAVYILRHQIYSFNGMSFYSSENIAVRNVTLYSVPGMGFYGSLTRNIELASVAVAKREGRPMSITADAVHFSSCAGDIVIRDSLFEGQGDDGLNVHGKFGLVNSTSGGNTIRLAEPTATEHMAFQGVAGDTIEFRKRATFQPYYTATAAAVNATHVVMAAPLPASVLPGDALTSISWMPSFTAFNNVYRNNRARCQLIKTHNVNVYNNVYEGCSGVGVQVFTDVCFWFESHPVANWTVHNNTFSNLNYGPGRQTADVYVSACVPSMPNLSSGQVHRDIAVEGNSFSPVASAVAIWAAQNVSVTGNIVHYGSTSGQTAPSVSLTSCTQTTVADNHCLGPQGTPMPCPT